jgi:hypothetical protein
MTEKEAAEFAGCSISTLKRYCCGWCEQSLLHALTRGCGAIYEKCDPKDKPHFPWRDARRTPK